MIGEALVRISEIESELLDSIPESEKIIGFRNVLVHGYDLIDDQTVWSAIESHLTTLLDEVVNLRKAR